MEENKKELNEMSPEEMGNVSGGAYFYAKGFGHDHLSHEIIGDKGEIIASFHTKEDAMDFANSKGISTQELTFDQLEQIRKGKPTGLPEDRAAKLRKIIEEHPEWFRNQGIPHIAAPMTPIDFKFDPKDFKNK